MKYRTGFVCFLAIFLMGQPAMAEETVAGVEGDESKRVEAGSPYLLPGLSYSESPFEQGTTTNVIGEIPGSKAGYIHPYLAVGEYFTDNLFNREFNRQSDFFTRITPGIWVSLPASRYPLRQMRTLNTAPGGLALSRLRTRGDSRIQAYGGYQADILEYSRFSSEDQVNQRGEGFFRYNFRGGLSVEVLDIYELDHDAYGTGISRTLDKFESNLLDSVVSYEISPKTSVEAEYGYYTLSYDKERNQFRDRDDHSFTGRAFYRFMPRTSAILEYNFVAIDYDEEEQSDSDEHRVNIGLDWKQSGKSRWRLMVGLGEKDFDDSRLDDATNILAELQFRHRFTPKTYVELRGSRKTNETDSPDTDYILSHKIQLRYYQRITARFLASVNLFYENTNYRGDSELGDRKDDRYGSGFDLKWTLANWMALSGGYSFIKRSSNFSGSEYDTNKVYLNLIFSL
jgi:hypothetical protein